MRARFTFGLSVASGEKICCTRLKIERHGSVAKPPWRHSPSLASRYATLSRKRLPYDTLPSAKPKRFSMATPSNQWASRRPPTSSSAGVTRTSAPVSHAGSSPVTGSRSTEVSASVGNFWTLHHAQLYTEPERLAKGGYVSEKRERGGRRRRLYEITDKGRAAIDDWRREPTAASLAEYEAIREGMPASVPRGPRLALEAGIRNERHFIAFWEELAEDG